jgi:hypothetical protein|nr:MAG TPA: minor capsid protein [Caudoviricetes sp.]
MARQNKYDKKHLSNLSAYERQVDRLYRQVVAKVASLGIGISDLKPDKLFSFDDYPVIRKRVEKLLAGLQNGLSTIILNGIESEWTLANNKNNELARQVFGDNIGKLTQEQYKRYFSTNDNARQAFIQRQVNGLNLSDRVWRYTNQFKAEIELGLDIGIRSGMSADDMTRELRDYLRHTDKLFRRVRDEHGILQLSKRAAAFHPGQGVYRSSYKNARRLAATETNIAYRTADYERWQQLDFVVGIEIKLSNNHPVHDICDELKGRYPKDFKFTGWHPHCRCHAITILKTDEEIAEDTRRILNGEPLNGNSVNRVADVPDSFNEWIQDNKERAKGWSSMPYFVKDNPQYVRGFEVDTYSKAERKFTRARHTSDAMKESLGVYLQKRYPEMPNTEKAAIYHYTQGNTSAYRQLNNQLRKGNLSEFNQAFSELLSAGLAKLPTVEETVYRTVRLNKTTLAHWKELAGAKGNITFKGYTSASKDIKTVGEMIERKAGSRKNNETDVLLVIKGKSGHPIEDLSQFGGRFKGKPNQQELLFDKGMRFKFEAVYNINGQTVFHLIEE